MIWSTEKPSPVKNGLEQRNEEVREQLFLNQKSSLLNIVGASGSGKTHCLMEALKLKPNKEHALVVMTWTTERKRWKHIVEAHGLENTTVHSPDSLALYLINSWSRRESKSITWVDDQNIEDHRSQWLDSKSYAETMLSKGKITIGIAHWLLKNEIDSFIQRSMVPTTDLLYLDEPQEWEPEAYSWIKHLPHKRLLTTSKKKVRSQGEENILLEGLVANHAKEIKLNKPLNSKIEIKKELFKERWVELKEMPTNNEWKKFTFVTQKMTPQDINFCKQMRLQIRSIEQTKGRTYTKLWLKTLPTYSKEKELWGDKAATLEKLNLLSSRGPCFTTLNTWDPSSTIPNKKGEEKYLIWNE